MKTIKKTRTGFTLIELSIVLVIIGLIVGGVLVGQDLIHAAAVRATISQIEKYNTAVNTFRGKYGALPGDLNSRVAAQFGFDARGTYAGEGDGNGIIEGVGENGAGNNVGIDQSEGETCMFWVDLSYAHGMNLGLIDSSFKGPAGGACSAASDQGSTVGLTSTPSIANFLPAAKIGRGNYIYVYSGGTGCSSTSCPGWVPTGVNYFGISAVSAIHGSGVGSNPGLTEKEAYDIDRKMDDGLPQSGNVIAQYVGGYNGGLNWDGSAPGIAALGSSGTCYDNNSTASAPMSYSLEISTGSYVNCALSFKLQ